ncbi:MAG: hypothetical protein PHH98_03910 [Candidatus Gracilibacteria bacterium]|nr:hypothetical protein [Candidatus Gracilibacteria bacterium]
MKKITIITLFSLVLLASCGTNNSVGTETTQGKKQLTKEEIQVQQENRTKAFMSNASEETKKLFTELDEIKKTGDKQKEDEKIAEIKKVEESKRLELDEAVKSGDNEKAKTIRKELMIFTELNR